MTQDIRERLSSLEAAYADIQSENHSLRQDVLRLEGIVWAQDAEIRALQSETHTLRQDHERLQCDVVYLEGAVR